MADEADRGPGERLYTALLKQIAEIDLAPGEKLPSEQFLHAIPADVPPSTMPYLPFGQILHVDIAS